MVVGIMASRCSSVSSCASSTMITSYVPPRAPLLVRVENSMIVPSARYMPSLPCAL